MDTTPVLHAILVIWAGCLLAYLVAAVRDRKVPADDIGVVLLLVFALYTTLPPLSWLLQGGHYVSELSGRLYQMQPPVDVVMSVMQVVLGYAISFVAVFVLIRGRAPKPITPQKWGHIPDAVAFVALMLFALSFMATLTVQILGLVQGATSYADRYRVIAELPTALRQAMKLAEGFGQFSQIVLLVAILQRGRRWRKWIAAYVFALLLSYDPGGSRAALVLGLGLVLIGWHVLVRRIPFPAWLALCAIGLSGFTLMGVVRTVGGVGGLGLLQASDLFALGEFDSLWANNVQLLYQQERIPSLLGWEVRFSEFFAFIPSQLLPFEKLSLDQWYLNMFYPDYRDAGGGWAFGLVAQAIVGGGVVEACIRGAALALLAVLIVAWARRHSARWWVLPTYLYLLINAYLVVRSSMLAPLVGLLQFALPCIVLMSLGAGLVALKSRRPPTQGAAS